MKLNLLLCRHSGFGNSIAFGSFDDNDFVEVENFVRNVLKKRAQQSDIFNSIEAYDLFGTFYAKQPENFAFNPGERKLIKKLASYVKKKLDEVGPSYFNQTCKKRGRPKGQMFETEIGFLYGELRAGKQNAILTESKPSMKDNIDLVDFKPPMKDNIDLVDSLFKKAAKCLIPYGDGAVYIFKENNVVVDKSENGKIHGHVYCVLCKGKKRISVHFQKTYWVVQNFSKHLRNAHPIEETSFIEYVEDSDKKIAKQPIISENASNFENQSMSEEANEDDTAKSDNKPNVIEDDINVEVQIESDGETINLRYISGDQLQPAASEQDAVIERLIYDQISMQEAEMWSAVFRNTETVHAMPVKFSDVSNSAVDFCDIAADGNCLFGSIVHQLFKEKINSSDYSTAVNQLRIEVVEHIKKNRETYQMVLKGRAYEELNDRKADELEINAIIDYFLSNLLPKVGTWAGSESLLAISEIYKVNIFIFNENDCCTCFGGFNAQYHQCILIAYGSFCNLKIRNHYNSVVRINQPDIFACAKKFSKSDAGHHSSVIELDEEEFEII